MLCSARLQIAVNDDAWTVFRRYSRFREMHKSLKLKYPEVSPSVRPGAPTCSVSLIVPFPPQLAALEFPPKKLFGNRDERMVAERRNHLEVKASVTPSKHAGG